MVFSHLGADQMGRERESFITSFPAISGLIRCVEDPFQALIDESLD